MFIQPQVRSLFTTMLSAGRRIGDRTRHQSHQWLVELKDTCHHAAVASRSLHGLDRKSKFRRIRDAVLRFLSETYLRQPARLIRKGIGKRTACYMIAALVPLLTALLIILVPALIFDSPDHRAYYFFARILAYDPVSLGPVLLGLLTFSTMLRFPSGPQASDQPG